MGANRWPELDLLEFIHTNKLEAATVAVLNFFKFNQHCVLFTALTVHYSTVNSLGYSGLIMGDVIVRDFDGNTLSS
jgi:hypothetical protein